MNKIKKCRICGKSFPNTEEYFRKRRHTKLATECKECYGKLIYQNIKDRRKRKLEKLSLEQDNKCAICKSPNPNNIDHNHKTGKIRGLLCYSCNIGLGQFKDNIELLEKAIIYLKITS